MNEIYESLIKQDKKSAETWLEYIELEQFFGYGGSCRNIYKRAMESIESKEIGNDLLKL